MSSLFCPKHSTVDGSRVEAPFSKPCVQLISTTNKKKNIYFTRFHPKAPRKTMGKPMGFQPWFPREDPSPKRTHHRHHRSLGSPGIIRHLAFGGELTGEAVPAPWDARHLAVFPMAFPGRFRGFTSIYPLVNIQKTMDLMDIHYLEPKGLC